MYINKWKLLLHDATESVYIGGLCNRILLVFGTMCLGIGGWVNKYFSFRVKKKNICTLYFDCFFVPKTHATTWRPAS